MYQNWRWTCGEMRCHIILWRKRSFSWNNHIHERITFNTLLVDVECVINARPLTYVYNDQEGISYPLTPSQLINGRNFCKLPHEHTYEIISTHERLSRRGKYNRAVLGQLTSRWCKKYLTSLLEAYRSRGSLKEPNINIWDIVILQDTRKKRHFWNLCKIVHFYKGQNGSIRSSKVEMASPNSDKKLFNSSVKLLIPLEVESSNNNDTIIANGNTPQASAQRSCSWGFVT